MTTVQDAFRNARVEAVRHMRACELAALRWSETTITEIVLAHAATAVYVVPFTQPAEAVSGADWVWWWVDDRSAYGMLIQAKRLRIKNGKWSFGFGYLAGSSRSPQRELLRSTAKALDLLPVYALYLGTGNYRSWESCSDGHRKQNCPSCIKRSVSLMPELLATDMFMEDSGSVYESSVALEELWTPATERAWLSPLLDSQLEPELREFLHTRQDGTRAVTRSMMDRVLRARYGAFSASLAEQTIRLGGHDELGHVFGEVPDDTGHFHLPYFEHTLTPLRHAPPGYVLDIMAGEVDREQLASDMPENVAGVGVVRLPPRQE